MVEHPAAVRQVLGSTPSVPLTFSTYASDFFLFLFFISQNKRKRAKPGFEPGTSCTQSRNHTPRPLATASGGSTRKKRNDDLARERKCKKFYGSGGIRTHAPEETGALNQRLRPLGHATLCLPAFPKPAKTQAFMSSLLYLKSMPPVRLELTAFRL